MVSKVICVLSKAAEAANEVEAEKSKKFLTVSGE